MKLLVVNDDGFDAPGLSALIDALSKKHEIYVAAPLKHMSGKSHGITLFSPMTLHRLDNPQVSKGFAIDGTPVDCVKVACLHLFKDQPFDYVISGINNGANIGDDLIYSGTFAAAHEAWRMGIKAFAVSLDNPTRMDEPAFKASAEHFAGYFDQVLSHLEGGLYNVNYPECGHPLGVRVSHLASIYYEEEILETHVDGHPAVMLKGTASQRDKPFETDFDVIKRGKMSITPISYSYVDEEHFKRCLSIIEKTV